MLREIGYVVYSDNGHFDSEWFKSKKSALEYLRSSRPVGAIEDGNLTRAIITIDDINDPEAWGWEKLHG